MYVRSIFCLFCLFTESVMTGNHLRWSICKFCNVCLGWTILNCDAQGKRRCHFSELCICLCKANNGISWLISTSKPRPWARQWRWLDFRLPLVYQYLLLFLNFVFISWRTFCLFCSLSRSTNPHTLTHQWVMYVESSVGEGRRKLMEVMREEL